MKVVSVLGHPLEPFHKGQGLPEEHGEGWHFQAARAIKRYLGVRSVAIRPGLVRNVVVHSVEGVDVLVYPAKNSLDCWKFARFVCSQVEKDDVLYIHNYRSYIAQLIIEKCGSERAVLQNHGTPPPYEPYYSLTLSPRRLLGKAVRLRWEKRLSRLGAVFFVLNMIEKRYLELLGVPRDKVFLRTMGIETEILRSYASLSREVVRRELGLPVNKHIVVSYAGGIGQACIVKGAMYLPSIYRYMASELGEKLLFIIIDPGPCIRSEKLSGTKSAILVSDRVPRNKFLKIIRAADLYVLPATRQFYGGVGVAVLEALYLGVPVVSPTLREAPPLYPYIAGLVPPYISSHYDVVVFAEKALEALHRTNLNYKAIRSTIEEHYSWRAFARDFGLVVNKLLS